MVKIIWKYVNEELSYSVESFNRNLYAIRELCDILRGRNPQTGQDFELIRRKQTPNKIYNYVYFQLYGTRISAWNSQTMSGTVLPDDFLKAVTGAKNEVMDELIANFKQDVEEDPSIYVKYKPYIDKYLKTIDFPDWVIRSSRSNLWDLKKENKMEKERNVKTFEEYGQEWNQSISCPNCDSVVDINVFNALDQFKCFCPDCESEFVYPWGANWRWT